MILTVTPNPALDLTYTVTTLTPGAVHRVGEVASRPGGKGVNVARVLHRLGEPVLAWLPGDDLLGAALVAAGVPHRLLRDGRASRRTVVVQAGGTSPAPQTTSFWEPGTPVADPDGWARELRAAVAGLLGGATALVVSGSLPPGIDDALPAHLAADADAAGVPAVVDVDGAALRAAAHGGHAVLMPNADELAALLGHRPAGVGEVADAARSLCRSGAPAVVVTLGAEGMVAATAGGAFIARPPRPVAGNPTGAGDAAAAAVARALAAAGSTTRVSWPDALADAVALSASAVLCPAAGEIDIAAADRWRAAVAAERLSGRSYP